MKTDKQKQWFGWNLFFGFISAKKFGLDPSPIANPTPLAPPIPGISEWKKLLLRCELIWLSDGLIRSSVRVSIPIGREPRLSLRVCPYACWSVRRSVCRLVRRSVCRLVRWEYFCLGGQRKAAHDCKPFLPTWFQAFCSCVFFLSTRTASLESSRR